MFERGAAFVCGKNLNLKRTHEQRSIKANTYRGRRCSFVGNILESVCLPHFGPEIHIYSGGAALIHERRAHWILNGISFYFSRHLNCVWLLGVCAWPLIFDCWRAFCFVWIDVKLYFEIQSIPSSQWSSRSQQEHTPTPRHTASFGCLNIFDFLFHENCKSREMKLNSLFV